jgi:hypothetical protein
MFCTRCGASVPAGLAHCGACGMPMPDAPQNQQPYAYPTPQPQPYAAATVPAAYPGNPYPYVQTTPYDSFPVHRTVGNGFSITAIVLGCIALLIVPIITGPAAIVFGGVAKSRGESRSTLALVIAIAGTVIGMIVGAIIGVLAL